MPTPDPDPAPARRALAAQALSIAGGLGVFVSTTTTGALSIPWILEGVLELGWIVPLQALAVTALTRLARVRERWPAVLRGYWSTHAPWAVLLVGLSALAVTSPDHEAWIRLHALRSTLLGAIVAAWAVSTALKVRYLRRGLGLSWFAAAWITSGLNAIYLGTPPAFLVLTGQLPIPVIEGYF